MRIDFFHMVRCGSDPTEPYGAVRFDGAVRCGSAKPHRTAPHRKKNRIVESSAVCDIDALTPWLCVQVRDIPALVVFDGATGEILTTTGCEDVSKATENRGNPRAVVRRW